jgi:hypothetical protein
MNILSAKIYNIDDACFFLWASTDRPYLYLKFGGVVKWRKIDGDSIVYGIQIHKVLQSKETIKNFLHRSFFRMLMILNNRAQIRRINCFDLTINFSMFDNNFKIRYKNYLAYQSSAFIFETLEELETAHNKTITIMKEHFLEASEALDLLTKTA